MEGVRLVSLVFIILGAILILVTLMTGLKLKGVMVGKLREKWHLLLGMLLFLLTGYLIVAYILISKAPVSMALITASIFLGGACFVHLIIKFTIRTLFSIKQKDNAYMTLVESSPNLVMLFNTEGRCLTSNKRGLQSMNATETSIKSMNVLDLWPKELKPQIKLCVQNALDGDKCMFDAYRFNGDNKEWWNVIFNPAYDRAGEISGFMAISTDITERKLAEQNLQEYTKKLEAFTEEIIAAEEHMKVANLETIHVLTKAAEFRDDETGDHIKRIGFYASMLAIELGFDYEYCEQLLYASPMHDVGKIAIPDSILLKQDELTVDEYAVMMQHTVAGSLMLEGYNNKIMKLASEIALCHHERWDGTGYPRGLKGTNIPIASRILSLADVYDALRSTRPYRKGLSHKDTYRIITEGDGRTMPSHFDPNVIDAFIAVRDKFEAIYNENMVYIPHNSPIMDLKNTIMAKKFPV